MVNSVQERRRGHTGVVLLEEIRYLKEVGVIQLVVITMVDQMAHMGNQAWITYAHMLQDARINARSGDIVRFI